MMNIMLRKILLLFILFALNNVAFANEHLEDTQAVTLQNIPYEFCTKMFEGINCESLFYKTLGAIATNQFNIDEIQSASGYIIFTAAKHKYLATVAQIDSNNSILKITPCNNIYFFQPGIISNIYKFIELNSSAKG